MAKLAELEAAKRATRPAKCDPKTLPIDHPAKGESFKAFLVRHYGAHPGQLAFLADPAKWRCVVAGIGGGKTELGAFETLRHVVAHPGIVIAGVSPTYRMLDRSMKPALRKVLSWWPNLPYEDHKSDQEFVFPTKVGADGQPSKIIFCHGGEPDALRAFTAGAAWLDEGPLCKQDVFRVLIGRLRQPGMPKRGWITGTPKGMNWVYQQFVAERDTWPPEKRATYSFHTWPSMQNPLYDREPGYIQDLRTIYVEGSDFWRQEVMASFVAFRGLVYQMFDAAKHCKPAPPASEFRETAYSVDWGVTSPGCILVFRRHRSGTWWCVDEVYERGKLVFTGSGNDWVSEAKSLIKQYGPGPWYCDPEDANAIGTFLSQGIPAQRANNGRIEGVRDVMGMLESRLLFADGKTPNTVAEFGQYHWREDRDGNPIEDADPAKEFDHAMDAVRYFASAVASRGSFDVNAVHEVPGSFASAVKYSRS